MVGTLTGSDWHQMGQIMDFLRSVSVHFGSSQNKLKLIIKKSQICPIWGHSDPIWMPNLISPESTHLLVPYLTYLYKTDVKEIKQKQKDIYLL